MARTRGSKRKDDALICALISSPTIREAAKSVSMSETTVYKRLADSDFAERYRKARLELISQATANIQGVLSDAVMKLCEIMNSEESSQQVKLNAADSIIRHCCKLTEMNDILTRLDLLEQQAARMKGDDDAG